MVLALLGVVQVGEEQMVWQGGAGGGDGGRLRLTAASASLLPLRPHVPAGYRPSSYHPSGWYDPVGSTVAFPLHLRISYMCGHVELRTRPCDGLVHRDAEAA